MVSRFAERIRTGRILVDAPTAVGALGGVYDSMTPTFSLAADLGRPGTTDNVNYRSLLNVKTGHGTGPLADRSACRRTSFDGETIDNLRQLRRIEALVVTVRAEERGVAEDVRAFSIDLRPRLLRSRDRPVGGR